MNIQEQNQVPHTKTFTGKQGERLFKVGKGLIDRDIDRTNELG